MYTKAQIWNLALSALLLQKQIIDTETDMSPEARQLRVHWDSALAMSLQDLDLDGTSTSKTLALVTEEPNKLWDYFYEYPSDCLFIRKIQNCVLKDNRNTQIRKQTGIINGVKGIFTDEEDAVLNYISKNTPLNSLSASAGQAIAFRLAWLCAPLITGKGAEKLKKSLQDQYVIARSEAQEHDRNENSNFELDEEVSEFVQARLS